MEKSRRNVLRAKVIRCRSLLEDALKRTLEGYFGIHTDGTVEPVRALPHLMPEATIQRTCLIQILQHRSGGSAITPEAVTQLTRAVAFTHLNRLSAFKLAERRGAIRETITRGQSAQGFGIFLGEDTIADESYERGEKWAAYRRFLAHQGQRFAHEVPTLFAPNDPADWVAPGDRDLSELIDLINDPEIDDVWDADETLGWIYQYFTPKEQRDEARKASSAPRDSYELSFRNQFYTPRYVVEFLTENTLGRIWYEMRKSQTRLATICRYLIRQRTEIWLDDGAQLPETFVLPTDEESFTQTDIYTPPDPEQSSWEYILYYAQTFNGYARESLAVHDGATDGFANAGALANARLAEYRQTGSWHGTFEELRACLFFEARRWRHFGRAPEGKDLDTLVALYRAICLAWEREVAIIPHRPKCDPRELCVLDPACGSGHFLLYAFEILLTIYDEAWDDPDLGSALHTEYSDKAAYDAAVPGLIIMHNLAGIDIDPRAVQLAALALWLRAHRAFDSLGLRRDERPSLPQGKIVCAVPMPAESTLRQQLMDDLDPPILRDIVLPLWDTLALAPEMGSLLKPELRLSQEIENAKRHWMEHRVVNLTMFSAYSPPEQIALNYTGVSNAEFFEIEAEPRVMAALEHLVSATAKQDNITPALFAADARHAIEFVRTLQRRYDVVLMNPPFGEPSIPAKAMLQKSYPRTKNDLYAAFVERGLELLAPGGRLGAITSRTGFFLTSFQKWREEILLGEARLMALADLGAGVLDSAMVETAAYVLERVDDSKPESKPRRMKAQRTTIS
jgi:hypothetical protein